MNDTCHEPFVSIILPTYNRQKFLSKAIESICAQSFNNWELIIVDDGSTDQTRNLIEQLRQTISQPVLYHYQENAGAYPARNTGLGMAQGKYIAFFDSDDYWLPHHLSRCTDALETQTEIDWVYGASKLVNLAGNRVVAPHSFYEEDHPRPFLELSTRLVGDLHIIDDPSITCCMILHGLYCPLQNSVIRKSLFNDTAIHTEVWNEAEDQLLVVRALNHGHRFAYYNDIHVIYNIHAANSSTPSPTDSFVKKCAVREALIRGYEELPHQINLSKRERTALNRRLSLEYFWLLGYATLWENNRRKEAVAMFRRGLSLWPWDWRYWKTYVLARIRIIGEDKQRDKTS